MDSKTIQLLGIRSQYLPSWSLKLDIQAPIWGALSFSNLKSFKDLWFCLTLTLVMAETHLIRVSFPKEWQGWFCFNSHSSELSRQVVH